jgi:fatty acid desaturase
LAQDYSQDYSLIGETGRAAVASGLSNPSWHRTKVDPAKIRKLMEKSDARALLDTAIWLALLAVTLTCALVLWPTWWSAPFWLAYGVLYASASDARWHECGHRTAFKTQWMNEAVYQLASFFLIRSPVIWRSSHVRHHTDTIIVGRDPEIQAMRPPDLARLVLNTVGLVDMWIFLPRYWLHLTGRIHPEEAEYLRPEDRVKVHRVARIWAVIYAGVIGSALWTGSILPLMIVGLPRLYGCWHMIMTGVLQHLGMAENVSDHRLNTRTVLMNPVSRFLYLNMNYHVEHHMFTMVPYYNLPKLHALIRHDLPAPEPSIAAAFRRMIPVLRRQLQYKDAVIVPDLPPGATPYRPEVEALRPHAV